MAVSAHSICTSVAVFYMHLLKFVCGETNIHLTFSLSLSLSLSLSISLHLARPSERTDDDIQLIYEELLHVKPFGHLSNAVRSWLYNTHVMIYNVHVMTPVNC